MVSLRLEGAKELERLLAELPASTAGNAARRGMAKALQPVAKAARADAPVDEGDLRDSIGVSSKLTPAQAKEAGRRRRDERVVYVGPAAPHAHLVEFGTEARFQKNGRFVGKMTPQPFMRPAWDANRDEVLASLTQTLRIEIEGVMARRAKRMARAAAKAGR